MFCPQCGSTQSDELKFCKACGANLSAVRQAVAARPDEEKFDWGQTWVAEMFLSDAVRKQRAEELERRRGVTPEVKRYNEIKAGVITSCVGIGVMIFLFVMMNGIILSGEVSAGEAEILSRVWVSGLIPFLIGLGIIFNGLVLSKRQVEIARREREAGPDALAQAAERQALRPGDTSEFVPADFSVTEGTTRHLSGAARKPRDSDGA
jgi:hypothetical protein